MIFFFFIIKSNILCISQFKFVSFLKFKAALDKTSLSSSAASQGLSLILCSSSVFSVSSSIIYIHLYLYIIYLHLFIYSLSFPAKLRLVLWMLICVSGTSYFLLHPARFLVSAFPLKRISSEYLQTFHFV